MIFNVKAVLKAPVMTNLTELNHYHGFIDTLIAVTELLHNLLRKGFKRDWEISCNSLWQTGENAVLTHFDVAKSIIVHCDASHVMLDFLEC